MSNTLLVRLKELRLERKATQKEVAASIGVAQSTYTLYETGNREPGLEALANLADYFDVSLGYLVGHSDIRGRSRLTEEEQDQLGRLIVEDENLEYLAAYRQLDNHGKAVVDAITRIELERIRYEQGGIILAPKINP